MSIRESAQSFAFALRSTKEFKDLITSKKIIEKNNMLKNEVIEFNKRLSSIYSSNKPQSIKQAKIEELHKRFSTLTKNEDVKKFLNCSDTFRQMMFKTNQYINQQIQNELILK